MYMDTTKTNFQEYSNKSLRHFEGDTDKNLKTDLVGMFLFSSGFTGVSDFRGPEKLADRLASLGKKDFVHRESKRNGLLMITEHCLFNFIFIS